MDFYVLLQGTLTVEYVIAELIWKVDDSHGLSSRLHREAGRKFTELLSTGTVYTNFETPSVVIFQNAALALWWRLICGKSSKSIRGIVQDSLYSWPCCLQMF